MRLFSYLSEQRLHLDVLSARCEQNLALRRDCRSARDPLLQRIDGVEVDRIHIEALARMSYSNLQRHSGCPPATTPDGAGF